MMPPRNYGYVKGKRIIKALRIFLITCGMAVLFSITAFADATFSNVWVQDASGNWKVKNSDGSYVTNAWLCDDAIAANGKDVWYLLDANGNMVSAGLVQDGTGNYYSLETNHNGYYGMLRYKSGNYDGINLSLDGSHNGSFAAIQNQDGIQALKDKFGLTSVANIDNTRIVYTSQISGAQTQAQEQKEKPKPLYVDQLEVLGHSTSEYSFNVPALQDDRVSDTSGITSVTYAYHCLRLSHTSDAFDDNPAYMTLKIPAGNYTRMHADVVADTVNKIEALITVNGKEKWKKSFKSYHEKSTVDINVTGDAEITFQLNCGADAVAYLYFDNVVFE